MSDATPTAADWQLAQPLIDAWNVEAELRGDGRERIMLTDADAVGLGRGSDGADRA